MWYRCLIGPHYRVRIERVRSQGKRVYWTARIVFVSSRYPQGRLVANLIVEYNDTHLWQQICRTVRRDR